MLFLTRTAGEPRKECVVLNAGTPDEVRLVIRSAAGKRVKVGVDAPSHVTVHREEVLHGKAR